MDFEEAFESPAFWILGGMGSVAVLLGWIWSRKAGWEALPIWQVLVLIVGIIIASAFFATRE